MAAPPLPLLVNMLLIFFTSHWHPEKSFQPSVGGFHQTGNETCFSPPQGAAYTIQRTQLLSVYTDVLGCTSRGFLGNKMALLKKKKKNPIIMSVQNISY